MKRKLTTLFFILITAALFGQVPTNGLVGYYPFTGNANDMSGNGYNGTNHYATLTTDRYNVISSAYYFNGTTGYISLPYTPFLLQNYSFSVWAYPVVNPANTTSTSILDIGGSGGD